MNSKELIRINLQKRWRIYEGFLIFIAVLEMFMMAYGLLSFDFHSLHRRIYFGLYVFLFSVTAAAILLNRYSMNGEKRLDLAVRNAYVYSGILIIWSALLSSLDMVRGGFPVTYMTILAAVGSTVVLSPLFYLCMSVFSLGSMMMLAMQIGSVSIPFSAWMNYVIFLIVSLLVQYQNYRSLQVQYQLNRQLEEWEGIDTLTGILNRRSMDDYMERLYRDREQYTYVLIDVDNFKMINDTYGHKEGDVCLIEIAELLSRCFGKDTFRYGGDEFAVISFERAEDIKKKLDRMNVELGKTHSEYSLQICAGIYRNDRCLPVKEVFSLTDSALYQAKRLGKAQVVIGEGT